MSDFYEPSLTPAQWKQVLFQEPSIPLNDDWTPSEPYQNHGSQRSANGYTKQSTTGGWHRRDSNETGRQNRRRYRFS